MNVSLNVARRLTENARAFPDKPALIVARQHAARGPQSYIRYSYRELDETSDAYAHGLKRIGIERGTKTIVMLKPGPELFPICFALFKIGAIPVVVDPGMGVKRMLACYKAVGAEAFIGIPIAHVVRLLQPTVFSSLKILVTVGRRGFWGGYALPELAPRGAGPFPIADTSAGDLAVLNFTTGSTGPAKGVEYTHLMADAMVRRIESEFGQTPSDVSLATVPLFAIFDLLIGSTSILPAMDPTKPALVDAEAMTELIGQFGVTTMFASPAFLHRVGRYANQHAIKLPSLRCLIAGGAPVKASIVECVTRMLGAGTRFATTYGATEALPIASIDAQEILQETRMLTGQGHGTCVGRAMPDLRVRFIRICDEPIRSWSDDLQVAPGEVGEIVISGPTVSQSYHGSPSINAQMKIVEHGPAGERTIWHRTGDLGFCDVRSRIWFCGRKSQRVTTARGTLFTVQVEGIFNAHPEVHRTALVGVGKGHALSPVLCVELAEGVSSRHQARIVRELRQLAEQNASAREIETFVFHPSFPVDIRHNAKINREELAKWARRELGLKRLRKRKWRKAEVS